MQIGRKMTLLVRCARIYSLLTLTAGALIACSSSSDEKTATDHQAIRCNTCECNESCAPPPPPDPVPDPPPPPSSGDPGGGGGGPSPLPYCSTGQAFTDSCSTLFGGTDDATKCAREKALNECGDTKCYDTNTGETRAFSCEAGLGRCSNPWGITTCSVTATGR